LGLAAADDITQRRPNPYFIRASGTSSQAMQPLADYAAKELKLKRVITISEDFAFGYEQMGGFHRVFEDPGGRVVKANGHLVDRTIKTYHDVSQFWTYDEKWFLAQPVYSRDYPPLKS